ncbi:hypothetical protein [Cryptosporangium sp. NPDC051539]|uniref:hypothetical protein n=1 Tax=Cryptosporangium sp. NPDC051539 TaxID=3363962 RepID=UPI0037A000C1
MLTTPLRHIGLFSAALVLLAGAGCAATADPHKKVATDYVAVFAATAGAVPGKSTTAAEPDLIGPHRGLRITEVSTLEKVDQDEAELVGLDGAVAAEDGYELVFALVTGLNGRWYRETADVQVTLAAGSKTVDLLPAMAAGAVFPEGNNVTDKKVLAVSVPRGKPATIRLVDAGRTQSFDLRAAKRGNDTIAGYYPLRSVDQLTPYDGVGTATNVLGESDDDYHVGVSVSAAAIDPYTPDHGWAKAGRAWLTLSSVSTSSSMTVELAAAVYRLDTAEALTLVTADGKRIGFGDQNVPYVQIDVGNDGGLVVLDVPADLTSATLEVDPIGSFDKYDDGRTSAYWQKKPASGGIPIRFG